MSPLRRGQPQRSRRRAGVRRAAVAALVLLLCAAAAGLWLARTGKAREWLGERVAAALGPAVHFRDARLALWPPLAVVLDDVAWRDADGQSALSATHVTARLDLRALLQRELRVGYVVADGLDATVLIDGAGLRLAGQRLGDAPADARDATALDAWLPRLRVRDGTLRLLDTTAPAPRRLVLSGVQASVEPARPGARLELRAHGRAAGEPADGLAFDALTVQATVATLAGPLRGDARLEASGIAAAGLASWLPEAWAGLALQGRLRLGGHVRGDLASGEVRAFAELADGRVAWRAVEAVSPAALKGTAAWRDGRLHMALGEVEVAGVHHAALDATELRAGLRWDGTWLSVRDLRATAAGGTWTQRGQATFATPLVLDGGVRGERVDGAALARALRAFDPSLAGLRARGRLTVDVAARGTLDQSLQGRLELHQTDGTLGWSALDAGAPLAIAMDITQRGAAWTLQNGQAQAAGLTLGHAALRDLDGRFGFANGALRVDALQAGVQGERWQFAGTLPLRLGATGSVRASGRAGRVAVPDLEASFVRREEGLRIPALRARVFGADWTGSAASISAAGVHAEVQADGVDLDALLVALDADADAPRSRDGRATIRATVTLRGDVERPDAASAVDLDLQLTAGQFRWRDLHADAPGRFTGRLRSGGGGGPVIEHAAASAAAAGYGALHGTQPRATFTYAATRLAFSALSFQAAGGSWQHQGEYRLTGAVPFEGQLTVRGVDPSAALAMLGRPSAPLEGTRVDLDAYVHGRARGDWIARLGGGGHLAARGGNLRSTAIIGALWDALLRRARRHDVSPPPNPLRRLSADFTLADGAVHTDDLELLTKDYTLTGRGRIGLDGHVDLDTRITLTAAGAQHMIALGSVPLPTALLPSLPPIPTHLSGSVDALIVRPEVAALPASTLRWAADAAIDLPRAVGDAVVKPFERLFGANPATPTPAP